MKVINKIFKPNFVQIELLLEAEEDQLRLDEVAKTYIKSLSRESIKKMIKNGDIFISNRSTKNSAHTKVKQNDSIILSYQNEFQNKLDLNSIIYEDDYLIAMNKPAGMLVHPNGVHLFNVASVLIENYLNKKIYPLHRLDKDTSGVLIFAKDIKTAQKMRTLFDLHLIDKRYYFKSHNCDNSLPINGIIELNLRPEAEDEWNLKQKVDMNGVSAITKLYQIKKGNQYIEGIASPITGRTHQIRCHLSYLGAPIIGDRIYGINDNATQLALCCQSMEFHHPQSNEKIIIHL